MATAFGCPARLESGGHGADKHAATEGKLKHAIGPRTGVAHFEAVLNVVLVDSRVGGGFGPCSGTFKVAS